MNCCIYGIRATNETEYFYVGSSKHSAKARLKGHLKEVKDDKHSNPHFRNKVRLVGAQNVVVDVLDMVDPENRFKAEYEWIKRLRREGHPLTNIQLQPWPCAQIEVTPAKLSYWIIEGALAPADCGIPQNQAIYSAMRRVIRATIRSMILNHKQELLHFLATGEMLAT